MTDEQIRSAINNCKWNDNVFNGYNRDNRDVICRGYCLPCLAVIDSGKCDTLIELFKADRSEVIENVDINNNHVASP